MRSTQMILAVTTAVLFTAVAVGMARPAAPAAEVATTTPAAPPPVPVDVAMAVAADFAPIQWTPGSIASREDANVAAEIGGRVVEIAEVGTPLKRGDVLARIDDTALRLRERHAEADLGRLRAQLEFSRRQEERYAALVRGGGISGAQLDQVAAERRMREQDVTAAAVALEQARLQSRQSTVRAPFDGVVVERATERGEFLVAGAPVARLVNTHALEVRTRAPVALSANLREGTVLTLRDGSREIELPLTTLVPVGDAASRQLELRIALDRDRVAEGGWVVGAALQVGVPSDRPRQVVAVPRDALVMRADGVHVVRVGVGETTERIPVEPGNAQDGLVEVEGAVRPGDRLVVRGGERLQAGQRVSIGPATGAAAAAVVARTQP